MVLHSIMHPHLHVKSELKSYGYKKPSDETSVIGRKTFKYLDLALNAIMQNLFPVEGVSL